MKYEYKKSKDEKIKSTTIKAKGAVLKITMPAALVATYFSAVEAITKPLYFYYQSKLVDVSQMTEINALERAQAGKMRR